MCGGGSCPWSSKIGIAALQGDLLCSGEMIFLERRGVCQDGDLGFLGHDGLCGCALQRSVRP